jgi:hypothetical protein
MAHLEEKTSLYEAMWRGFRCRCPKCGKGHLEGTVKKVVRKIIELSRQGVHFATFPETVRAATLPLCSGLSRWARNLKSIEQSVTVLSATTRAISGNSTFKLEAVGAPAPLVRGGLHLGGKA